MMATYNPKKKEIDCKIVYYGAALSGKTTNLIRLHEAFPKYVTADLVSIETKGDRTLFFDFLPMGLGKIKGAEVRLHLYTVPGHAKYRSTRKMVLRGVDGLVFVADSMEVQRRLNMESLRDLQQNLKDYGMSIYQTPLVLQFNKRDLAKGGPSVMSLEQMEKELNGQLKVPAFPASAIKGKGIGATLKKCLELTLESLQKELHWGD